MILCECGEFVKNSVFKEYIPSSASPSTRTIGHEKCGIIFNFIDDTTSKNFSSRKDLKVLAGRFAKKNNMTLEMTGRFLLEVDRLKSCGNMYDYLIILTSFNKMQDK
ncbi:hypothetical protein RE474_12895 [Methanolobus sediminis]|uniref:Uncharacterized protein n=1 Tax=Methanolobus sediminis TaxID=3072978 RepID=A0AA51UK95_9EURY|nr:hypothetical protein [Methanolobus sediminis]WMW24960.1 hypothetical protein RE474_12895 [Methanolobus sediminis]